MINESKQAIKQVFDSFDKDQSGFVDSNELIAISKELNQELQQEEVDKLMKVVDFNKDGKISFQEFWDWWQYGKNGKLEKLVFLKLKMQNLFKRVNSNFTRFGKSLAQKYEGNKNYHYFALNFGETLGHCRIKGNLTVKGDGVQQEIIKMIPTIQINSEIPIPQFIITIKSEHPEIAKKALQEAYDLMQKVLKDNNDIEKDIIMILGEDQGVKVQFTHSQTEVIINYQGSMPFFMETIANQYLPFMEQLGEKTEILAEINFGIKNGLKKLLAKNLPFVKWFLEGFLLEINASLNKDFMSNILNVALLLLEQVFMENQNEKKRFYQKMIFPFLLRSTKFHLTFKNMQDVNALLRGMGLDDIAEDQPTGRALLAELFSNHDLAELQDAKSKPYFLYKVSDIQIIYLLKFIKAFQEHCIAAGNCYFIMPKIFASFNYSLDGLKEVFDCILKTEKGQNT